MKYTPGTWIVNGDRVGPIRTYGYEGCEKEFKRVATVPQLLGSRTADLHLIAAAPEMYEALKNLENDNAIIPEHAWKLVKDAIAKAEGKI